MTKRLGIQKRPLKGGVKALEKCAEGFNKEFMEFLQNYQEIGLAVAVVIGTATTKLVNSIVSDIIMPIIAVIIPGKNWQKAVFLVGSAQFLLGDFVGQLLILLSLHSSSSLLSSMS
ncbi:MAG: MscL family protein [Methanomicrobiales archaeon]